MPDRLWTYECAAGKYWDRSLWRLLAAIVSHRFWHWRRGDGWVD